MVVVVVKVSKAHFLSQRQSGWWWWTKSLFLFSFLPPFTVHWDVEFADVLSEIGTNGLPPLPPLPLPPTLKPIHFGRLDYLSSCFGANMKQPGKKTSIEMSNKSCCCCSANEAVSGAPVWHPQWSINWGVASAPPPQSTAKAIDECLELLLLNPLTPERFIY